MDDKNTMDDFEKGLEAITVPEKWLNGNQYRTGYRQACLEIAAAYRAFKAKADGGLVEKLTELQKEIYALKLKERDGLANPETELNDRYRLGLSAGLGIASDKMVEILRAHEGGEK